MPALDLNPQFLSALSRMEDTDESLFITGRAGTGKSTLLQYFKNHSHKKLVVLAPTGVAAVNIGGATIHSFFGFKPDITPEKAVIKAKTTKHKKLYLELKTLVIDEISMVRADLLDCVDIFLRAVCGNTHPFGGKQLLMFGDLYQLPPVVSGSEKEIFSSHYSSPFFFAADAISRLEFSYLELTHIYRQSDPDFIDILNAVRSRTISESHLALLNTRVHPEYAPPPTEYTVHLTGTNQDSATYNATMLADLPGESYQFLADATKDFDHHIEPAPRELELKIGAQVMLTHNDHDGRYINGTVARVLDLGQDDSGEPAATVRLQNGEEIVVTRHSWEMYRFFYNGKTRQIESDIIGTYTQLPLILAWSITIHKSQGKTFDKVIIDLPRSFAHGQTYVALSRCTSLQGIILKKPLSKSHILMDFAVVRWLTNLQYGQAHATQSVLSIKQILAQAITDESAVEIVYLKGSNDQSTRVIHPSSISERSFLGHAFVGVDAYDDLRHDFRVFNLERILSARHKAQNELSSV